MDIAIEQALTRINDPLLGESLSALGMVHDVQVKRGGRVMVQLLAPAAAWPGQPELAEAVCLTVGALDGVTAVDVQWQQQPAWTPQRLAAALQAPLGPLDATSPRGGLRNRLALLTGRG